jgi:hypothetical protein
MKSSPYSPHYEKLQTWLKEQRGKSGYSQREVSEIMNRHHSIVGKIEQRRKKIELLEFVKYCQILGADPHEGIALLMQSLQVDELPMDHPS